MTTEAGPLATKSPFKKEIIAAKVRKRSQNLKMTSSFDLRHRTLKKSIHFALLYLRTAKKLFMAKITAAITSVGGYVPEDKLTNTDLEKMVDTNDEWIGTRT